MKTVAIVTGTRAEYGLLKPLIKAISTDKAFRMHLIATGMHLSADFGFTYREIEQDGYTIDEKVDCELVSDTAEGITKSIGIGIIGFAEVFRKISPHLLLLLGDRTEILAAAIAAMIKTIPIAHIHGGETTEGAYDESIRHAITKMSYLHFTSAETYRNRVIQLGETPERVFNVGAIGIDSIKSLQLLSRIDFENAINFKLNHKNVLITFHPVTLENETAALQFKELLKSLNKLEHVTLIFTKPNSDKDGRVIIKLIDDYVAQNPYKALAFISLGQLRYLSALQHVDVVVGNSSSGIIEVPVFKKPTINIGDRQKGRIMPASVINCEPLEYAIDEAFDKAFDEQFKMKIQGQEIIYGNGNATPKIIKVLKDCKINNVKKKFYDLKI